MLFKGIKCCFVGLGISLWPAMVVCATTVADFDDLTLGAESFWNGSDLSGGFSSGSASFNNSYIEAWASWSGFAYSNITDTVAEGFSSQYNAIAGSGQSVSNYGVGFTGITPVMTLDSAQEVGGLYLTNNNYAYYSMLKGDAFAKKFGGAGGSEPDWFRLTITGKDQSGGSTGSVEFYLADFRFADDSQDYIVNEWTFIDLSTLGVVKGIEFALDSSDVGDFGMNTPAYFVIDTVIPEPATVGLLLFGAMMARRRKR